jgi:hypothetical protein
MKSEDGSQALTKSRDTAQQLKRLADSGEWQGEPGRDPRLLVNILGKVSQSHRGGKREGAGRKPAPPGTIKLPYNTKLTPDVVEYLRQLDNAAKELDDMVRRSKQFREWSKSR